MNSCSEPLDRATAAEYATWFRALADATRIQIVSLLARRGEPMNVGEIVAAVTSASPPSPPISRCWPRSGSSWPSTAAPPRYYRINEACVDCFPTAADIVMGRPVPAQPASRPPAQS